MPATNEAQSDTTAAGAAPAPDAATEAEEKNNQPGMPAGTSETGSSRFFDDGHDPIPHSADDGLPDFIFNYGHDPVPHPADDGLPDFIFDDGHDPVPHDLDPASGSGTAGHNPLWDPVNECWMFELPPESEWGSCPPPPNAAPAGLGVCGFIPCGGCAELDDDAIDDAVETVDIMINSAVGFFIPDFIEKWTGGSAIGPVAEQERALVEMAWAMLVGYIELVEWLGCVVDGSSGIQEDNGFGEPEFLDECLIAKLAGNPGNKVNIKVVEEHVCEWGGAFACTYFNTIYIPRTEDWDCLLTVFTDFPRCAAKWLSGILLHELWHTCVEIVDGGWDDSIGPDPGCEEPYLLDQLYFYVLMQLYCPVDLGNPCEDLADQFDQPFTDGQSEVPTIMWSSFCDPGAGDQVVYVEI